MTRKEVNSRQGAAGFSLLELVVVITVIGILAAGGLVYYEKTLDDAKRTAVEIMANRFTAAVALVRGQWIVESTMQNQGKVPNTYRVEVDNIPIFMNELGWPAATDGKDAQSSNQSAEECFQLWDALMQNQVLATVEGRSANGNDAESKGRQRYHISTANGSTCRYELVTNPEGTHFFEYNLRTGQVKVTVPPLA